MVISEQRILPAVCFLVVRSAKRDCVQANMNDIFRWSTVKAERGIDYPFARTVSFSIGATF